MQTYFHSTHEEIQTITETGGRFGEFLFFADRQMNYGPVRYSVEVSSDSICESGELFDYEESELPEVARIVSELAEAMGYDEDDAIKCIKGQIVGRSEIVDVWDEAVAVQVAAARIAVAIGFAGVLVEDETGTALMMPMAGKEGMLTRIA